MVEYIILAAGQGTRMCSKTPKVMHSLGGKPMVQHVLDAALATDPTHITLVISPTVDQKKLVLSDNITLFVMEQAWGTGYAVREALPMVQDLNKDICILCGDAPLLTKEVLRGFIQHHKKSLSPISLIAMRPKNPGHYGRLVTKENKVLRIVECRDATADELAISLCNSGILIASGYILQEFLPRLTTHNESKEYYLTDLVALAASKGIETSYFEADASSLQGINTRVELAEAEEVLQNRWRKKAMLNGVTMTDPRSVFLCHDTVLGKDVTIGPNVTFSQGVIVKDNVTILPNCHIENSVLEDGALIGPFSRLRGGCVVGAGTQVGNFVEIKASKLGPKVKVKHLSYIGDAAIGEKASIGAGVITCNYNGFEKKSTEIGAHVFVGSNVSLIAPVKIADGSIVGAGSVITDNIPANSLGIARAHQTIKEKWAIMFREKRGKKD